MALREGCVGRDGGSGVADVGDGTNFRMRWGPFCRVPDVGGSFSVFYGFSRGWKRFRVKVGTLFWVARGVCAFRGFATKRTFTNPHLALAFARFRVSRIFNFSAVSAPAEAFFALSRLCCHAVFRHPEVRERA